MKNGTMKVEDALLMIADDLDNLQLPGGLTVTDCRNFVIKISHATDGLRACSEALRNAAAKKAEAEEPEEPTSEGLFEESEE